MTHVKLHTDFGWTASGRGVGISASASGEEGPARRSAGAAAGRKPGPEQARAGAPSSNRSWLNCPNARTCRSFQRRQFRAVFEEGPHGIVLVGRSLRLLQANRAIAKMLGREEAEVTGMRLEQIVHPESRAAVRHMMERLLAGKMRHCRAEIRLLDKRNQPLFADLIATVVRSEEDEPVSAVLMIQDMTAWKRSEEQLIAALREKEVLLREIHHRVKNNLQVISSLLNLQAGYLKDEQASQMLRDSQNRVRSMALVHEQLHRSANLSKINFHEYVRSLAASLFCSYGMESSSVSLRLDVGQIHLNVDTAVACGLIIHELVSNSLKHAFPEGRKGEISIGLRAAPTGMLVLTVADNGKGFQPDLSSGVSQSLGLRLVSILVDQIEGTMRCTGQGGTRFQITFRAHHLEQEKEGTEA